MAAQPQRGAVLLLSAAGGEAEVAAVAVLRAAALPCSAATLAGTHCRAVRGCRGGHRCWAGGGLLTALRSGEAVINTSLLVHAEQSSLNLAWLYEPSARGAEAVFRCAAAIRHEHRILHTLTQRCTVRVGRVSCDALGCRCCCGGRCCSHG